MWETSKIILSYNLANLKESEASYMQEMISTNKKEAVDVTFFNSIETKEVEWLWKPYIAFGKLTILQGDPGDGKTTFALKLVSQLTSLQNREIRGLCGRKINVIYQSAEDGVEDSIKVKLEKMNADCKRIAFINKKDLSLDDKSIEQAIKQTKAQLLVLDPIQSFIANGKSMSSVKGMRETLRQLAQVAAKTNCAILLIGHLNKSEGKKNLYRGLGSIDITAIARSVLFLKKSEYDPNIRMVTQIKNSLECEGHDVAYEFDKNEYIHWIGEYTEEFGRPEIKQDKKPATRGVKAYKTIKAKEIIKHCLDNDVNGATFILSKCKEAGISLFTTKKARQELGVVAIKINRHWIWRYE